MILCCIKRGADQVIRRCIFDEKIPKILHHCHSLAYRGHFGAQYTAVKVLQSGFFCLILFKDAYACILSYDRRYRVSKISRRHEWPVNNILEVEIFDVWGIDFIRPFPPSFGQLYILLAVDYVSK